jgi:hypothetical protein
VRSAETAYLSLPLAANEWDGDWRSFNLERRGVKFLRLRELYEQWPFAYRTMN